MGENAKNNALYSVKMRSSALKNGENRHISGAESITEAAGVPAVCESLVSRAQNHALGDADEIHIKIEKIKREDVIYLKALPVTSRTASSASEGREIMRLELERLGVKRAREVLAKLAETYRMRGAMLLDADSLERLEDDAERGLRVTRMDAAEDLESARPPLKPVKNHFREALVLATKAAHAPGVLAEICVSDDPQYTTGYVASQKSGYVRIGPLKEKGDGNGGRILLYRGASPRECIEFLQKKPVLVTGVPRLPPGAAAPPRMAQTTAAFLEAAIEEKKKAHLYRQTTVIESAPGPKIVYGGREILLLASNNYLNLASDPRLGAAAAAAAEKYGSGSGGSRLTTGTIYEHELLEAELAEWKGTEAALFFSTGYMANTGVIQALCSKSSVILSDEKNHASIIDGCRLSGARTIVYPHLCMEYLEEKASLYYGSGGLIVSDSVFSMDGDAAPLPRLAEIAKKYGFFLMLDEAHATGVMGETGGGLSEMYGITPDASVGTCSKALGGEGGFVCGSSVLINYLKNYSRPFIFSTAPSAPTTAAAREALRILRSEPERVRALREAVQFFCEQLRLRGIGAKSESAIVPIQIGDENRSLKIAHNLIKKGIYIPAIRYPSVPKNKAILRAAICCAHKKEDLDFAASVIAKEIQESAV
ncbi:MAG: 6-carboxyhexanoate--CoA ligase [Spirochaetaceae bacterium]|jgi:6-carboxyhexanoate--CoA ligase|nr:6-carboxyhexanoate--CoA ligase [Spirochaetaceae bacterium]